MKKHTIAGGGGVRLHVVETGNAAGRPILFIHGFSQCSLAWSRQLQSDLAGRFRLVAMDLRGHGHSDKPRDGYAESKLWADDINAVIGALALEQPVLCGWSYGPLPILDYVRHYGDSALAGIAFVGGVTKLGSDDASALLEPEFTSLVPGFFSSDVEECTASLRSLLRLCLVREPSAEEMYLMLGFNVSTPPFVRQALLSRALNNDDLLKTIRKPALIVHGAEDRVVKPAAAEQHRAALALAHVEMMPDVGHAPFWDDPPAFNAHLRAFCERVSGAVVT